MAELAQKIKNALDEARLLILVVQVLLGFQLRAPFEDRFAAAPDALRYGHVVALALLLAAFIIFVAPAPYLELVFAGDTSTRVQSFTGVMMTVGLLPFMTALAINAYIVVAMAMSTASAAAIATAFMAAAGWWWYGLAFTKRARHPEIRSMTHKTSLSDRLQQVMTESRMIVPGAQALLGFQFATVFTAAFGQTTPIVKAVHVAGMCSIALATILLIAPASFHRIAESGEDSERVVAVGARFVVLSLVPLALGIALDVWVVVLQTRIGSMVAVVLPASMLAVAICLWFVYPLAVRHRSGRLPGHRRSDVAG